MWYIEVGTQIIIAMIFEISAPHVIPMCQLVYYGTRRLWDRSCSCDKKKSRKVLQSDYEELYIGPEFDIDARLAQVVAIIWVTFMYSPGLPVLFLITAINFVIVYWIDKWLLLRFYRTPKNYDEICINFSLNEMKIAFIFHFILGSAIYSNDKILTSSGATDLIRNAGQPDSKSKSIFEVSRYNSHHVLTFIGGNVIIMLILFFESTIFGYIK